MAITKPSKWQTLLDNEDDFRKAGYIGKVPYALVLRWFTLFGILMRFWIHRVEYTGRYGYLIACILAAILLALFLSLRPLRPDQRRHHIEVFIVILLDIAIISVAYAASQRLQSDTYLFYFLPLILAAEYLPGRWVIVVSTLLTLAFGGVLRLLQPFHTDEAFTVAQVFSRVFLGREFFLLGFVSTAWYLFNVERDHKRRLEASQKETQALFDFSLKVDQLSHAEDLLREAVKLAVDTLRLDWGICVLFKENNEPWVEFYPNEEPAPTQVVTEILAPDRNANGTGANSSTESILGHWATEPLEVGKHRLGMIAVGYSNGTMLRPEARSFLKALAGSLLNGLRRIELIASLRKIKQETLKSLEFDRELDSILRRATEDLRLDFATITLKDDYRGVVETVRGRNVPPGLIRMSRYEKKKKDIQTFVIESGQTVVVDERNVDEYKEYLNKEIFDRFEHRKLARIWVPIRDGETIVGTIEAGCAKERREEVLTPEVCLTLETMGREKGGQLAMLRPQALLHLIATEAIRLIGADSASIHIFSASDPQSDDKLRSLSQQELANHFRHDKPELVAGAKLADSRFIQCRTPRPDGIGWEAIASMISDNHPSYRVINDPEQLRERNPEIFKMGVRAILAVPLRIAPDVLGVLYVHHWHAQEFSKQAIQIGSAFGAEIDVAIQSHMKLRDAAETIQDSRTHLEWLNAIQSPAKLKELKPVLEELAQKLLLVADADTVVLYQYTQSMKVFNAPPIRKGVFLDEKAMLDTVGPNHETYRLRNEQLPLFYEDVKSQRPELVASPAGHQRFVGREKIHSCAILALWAGEELFGILFVNYRNPKSFAPELRTRMQALASTAANVIRTARFYAWMTARDKQLKALEQVDRAIVDSFQGPGVNDFLNVILRESAHFSQATSGAIFRPTAENDENKLTAAACYTARETNTETGLHCRFGEGAAGRCAVSRKPEPVLRRDESEAGWISEESKSCIAIPIIASHENSELIGVLLLESDRYEAFAQEDQIVFQNLARQAVIGVHSIERYLQLKKEQNLAVAISTIATRIQRVEYSLDLVIYQILTAITADEGVGFSRAMVFLCEENCAALRGFSAKGEISCEDAHGTWEAAVRESSIEKALDDAIEYYRAVERGAKISALLAAIRGQVIPLQMGGAIARCAALNSNTYIPVRGDQADPFRAWISQTTGEDFEGISFVCVPLLIREKTIGVLVVDDRFKLIEKNEIPCTKIVRLTAYAELAAMSIESAQLMEKTQTQTYEDMAHQLKKPLARAKDHCAALTRNMGSKNRGTDDTLLKMKAMVGRALNVSMNLKLYADLARERPLSPKLTILDPYSLVQLIQNSVDDLRASTDPDLELIFQPLENNEFHELSNLMVMADMDLLREALENLLDNAVKYSFRGSTIVIRARSTYGPEGFKLIVGNTGKHIEADEVELIKRRGYRGPHSAEVTSEGSGIGLWVVNGIMAAHGGLLLPEPTTANHYTQIGLWFPTVSEGGRPS